MLLVCNVICNDSHYGNEYLCGKFLIVIADVFVKGTYVYSLFTELFSLLEIGFKAEHRVLNRWSLPLS